ncbi:hypothetical protein ACIO3O_32370 [Streptomyces sp. NPDC087440]|uniref:hypothetical protein n=1 Tax=Streptomyces sp. NPDC087440 TaxID=3365790 RepID=UPI0037FB7932
MPLLTRSMAAALAAAALLAGAATACTAASPKAPPLDLKATTPPPKPAAEQAANPSGTGLEKQARDLLGNPDDPFEEDDPDDVGGTFHSAGSLAIPGMNRDETVKRGLHLTVQVACAGKGVVTFEAVSGKARTIKRVDCAGPQPTSHLELTTAAGVLEVSADSPAGDRVGTAYVVRQTK